jgi:hypothetical protein
MNRVAIIVLLLAGLVGSAGAAGAQTISPIVQEYGKKANGTFLLTNNTVQPLAVTIEAYSFSVDKAGKHLRPLDSTVHLKLSETSARLAPKETHEVDYKIRCDSYPCLVTLLSGMVVGHTQGDKDHPVFQVRLILEHVVYLCEKQKGCRTGVLNSAGYTGPMAPIKDRKQNGE